MHQCFLHELKMEVGSCNYIGFAVHILMCPAFCYAYIFSVWMYCPWPVWVKGSDRAGRLAGKATVKWLWSQMIRSVELETLPSGTKQRTSHISHLKGRGTERGNSLQSSSKVQHQSDQHLNCLTGSSGEASEGGVEHVWAFLSAYIPPWTEQSIKTGCQHVYLTLHCQFSPLTFPVHWPFVRFS